MQLQVQNNPSKNAVETELSKRYLKSYVPQAWNAARYGPFCGGRVVDVICDHLQAVSEGKIKRLLINIPPRMAKSTICSVLWPTWDWIHNPTRKWLTLSYKDDLAMRDTRKHRNIIEMPWYQSRWPLPFSKDQNQKRNFENEEMGVRQCFGLDGGVTGAGGDFLIIDDAHDADEALNIDNLKARHTQFDEKIVTRLNDAEHGAIVVVGQRLSHEDLFAHLFRKGGWENLCLPMRFEPDHPHLSHTSLGFVDWRTEPGELLHPERFSEKGVNGLEKEIGTFATVGQLQQRPMRREGNMFNRTWFRLVEMPPGDLIKIIRYWDKASTQGGGDHTAGVLLGKSSNGDLYILDVVRGQWNMTARRAQIRATGEKDKVNFPYKVRTWIEQEGGSAGKDMAETEIKEFMSFGVKTEKSTGTKEVRAMNAVPMCENGHVFMVRGPWNEAFLSEIEIFTGKDGEVDDQVDAFSLAYNKLATIKVARMAP